MRITHLHPNAVRFTIILMAAFVLAGLVPLGARQRTAAAGINDTVILDWNRIAVEVFHNPPTAPTPGLGYGPQVSILHIAMVHGAIYDAVNMIDHRYVTYSENLPAVPQTASKSAAAATAAHHVIVGVQTVPALSPEIIARVDTYWQESLAAATNTDGITAVEAGKVAGEAAATAMLASRANDGRFANVTVEPGSEPGDWRPYPPSNAQDPNAWVGLVTPFLLESPDQFRSKGPYPVTSVAYARDYNEVKKLGASNSKRSQKQEAVMQFYTANPTEMYNRAFRTIATDKGMNISDQARLFAMLNMTGADALINCFNDKLHYNFWRPVTAIQLGDHDGNRRTHGDPNWTPAGTTPPYSEHASGYNCVTAAMMHTAADVFTHGKFNFTLVKVTPGQPDVTRHYKRFTDVIADTIDARIYQGIHFRNANVQGAELGEDVARYVKRNFFKRAK